MRTRREIESLLQRYRVSFPRHRKSLLKWIVYICTMIVIEKEDKKLRDGESLSIPTHLSTFYTYSHKYGRIHHFKGLLYVETWWDTGRSPFWHFLVTYRVIIDDLLYMRIWVPLYTLARYDDYIHGKWNDYEI